MKISSLARSVLARPRRSASRLLFADVPSQPLPIRDQHVAEAGQVGAIRSAGAFRDIGRPMEGVGIPPLPSRGKRSFTLLAADATPRKCVVFSEPEWLKDRDVRVQACADNWIVPAKTPCANARDHFTASPFAVVHSAEGSLNLRRLAGGSR